MRPGDRLARRPLHFIWIADASGSMAADGKIQALNNAIRESIPHLRELAASNPHAEVLVRAIAFSTGIRWHIPQPTPVDLLGWRDIESGGYTDLGTALSAVAHQLSRETMEKRALAPALVLLSDGQPTDDFEAGLQALMAEPWGQASVRLGIAIGRDADFDVLERFIGNPDIPPLHANNPEQLLSYVRWASVVASRMASMPGNGKFAIPAISELDDHEEIVW